MFVDVKLLNNSQGKFKMGLGYLIFRGKCDYLKQIEEEEKSKAAMSVHNSLVSLNTSQMNYSSTDKHSHQTNVKPRLANSQPSNLHNII